MQIGAASKLCAVAPIKFHRKRYRTKWDSSIFRERRSDLRSLISVLEWKLHTDVIVPFREIALVGFSRVFPFSHGLHGSPFYLVV